jgi:MarR family 2-MHQ and catechol resistance regulon transcriptional repressor
MSGPRPSDDSPQARVFGDIVRLGKRLERMRMQAMRETGLTPAQHYLLTLLWQKDERPFREIQDSHRCSRATLTGIMDTLEKKGLALRMPHPTDRRSLQAKLTSKGAALRRTVSTSGAKACTCCCSSLSAAELRTLSGLLAKLAASLPL